MLRIGAGCVLVGPLPPAVNDTKRSEIASDIADATIDNALRQPSSTRASVEAHDEQEEQAETAHRRKRRRKSKYVPNEREQDANVRAAAITPFLHKALQCLKTWMAENNVSSLQQENQVSEHASQLGHPSHYRIPSSTAAGRFSLNVGDTSSADALTAKPSAEIHTLGTTLGSQAVDYISLAAVRHVLRPKYSWEEHTATSLPGGGPCCNLFGQLIGNEGAVQAAGLAAGNRVNVPPHSAFLMSDVKQLSPLVAGAASQGGYHCIVMDPPWENKSAARGAKYPTLPSRNLLAIPLPQLMAGRGGPLHPQEKRRAASGDNIGPIRQVQPLAGGMQEGEHSQPGRSGDGMGGCSPLPGLPGGIQAPVGGCGAAHRGCCAQGGDARGGGGDEKKAGTAGGTAGGTGSPLRGVAGWGPALGDASGACGCGGGCEEGCLVAIWMTNRERHWRFVKRELLPGWGLRRVATWHWLKVTPSGEPVGRLDIAHRRPYEPILLCRPLRCSPQRHGERSAAWPDDSSAQQRAERSTAQLMDSSTEQPDGQPLGLVLNGLGSQSRGPLTADSRIELGSDSRSSAYYQPVAALEGEVLEGNHPGAVVQGGQQGVGTAANTAAGVQRIPDNLVLLGVPSQHSRKPHLGPLLREYLPPQPRCLELFAREMFEGWTSWGNEVLKFQSIEDSVMPTPTRSN